MADLAKVKLPSGSVYNLKDSAARTAIANLATVATTGKYGDLLDKPIYYKTTAEWNALPKFQGNAGDICIYSDYKTISDPKTITWDGDPTGKETHMSGMFVKVSDIVLENAQQPVGGTYVIRTSGIPVEKTITLALTEDENVYTYLADDADIGPTMVKTETTIEGELFTPGIYFATESRTYISDMTYAVTKQVAGIKVADGNAYIVDKAFLTEKIEIELAAHIANTDIHTTSTEKTFWNNKVNVEDTITGETLVITRN